MPQTDTGSRKLAAAALLILLLTCIGLTACGGSSGGTSPSANTASTGTSSTGTSTTGTSSTRTAPSGSSTTGAPPAGSPTTPRGAGPGSARFAALRECLQKNGITLPQRAPGSGRPSAGAGFLGGGGLALPKGVTRAQYQAALQKCGAGAAGGPLAGGRGRFNSPVFTQALAKYAECLRKNGVNVPAPNTSGKGPVFDTKGLDTGSQQFRTATAKCRTALVGAFRRIPRRGTESSG